MKTLYFHPNWNYQTNEIKLILLLHKVCSLSILRAHRSFDFVKYLCYNNLVSKVILELIMIILNQLECLAKDKLGGTETCHFENILLLFYIQTC